MAIITGMDQLPLKGKKHRNRIETRPAYIEDWLDALPYVDFAKTSRLVDAALQATNKADIKPSSRLALIELYDRPYQYYLASRILSRGQTTFALQYRAGLLKRIALNLSHACNIVVEAGLAKKTLWGRARPPIKPMLMLMNYLSQALIFSFFEYASAPKNIWQQINFNYGLAESAGLHKTVHGLAAADNKKIETSIEHSYKRIMLAALADPNYLPVGAIWEIYAQLDSWADHARIKPMQTVSDPAGYFVIELDKNSKAVPYSKAKPDNRHGNIRLLDTRPLMEIIEKHLELFQISGQTDESIVLSPYYVKSLLGHLLKTWGSPPIRDSERQAQTGSVKLVCGVDAIYYHINGGPFEAGDTEGAGEDEICISAITGFEHTDSSAGYLAETWRILDRSEGGCALIRGNKPAKPPRVGDLVGINLDGPAEDRRIGVVRWMMTRHELHKMGIQNIAVQVTPIGLRAQTGSVADTMFRPAFLVTQYNAAGKAAIIAERELYFKGRELKIRTADQQHPIRADRLFDNGISYEIFSYTTPAR